MDKQESQNLTPEQRAYAKQLSQEVEALLLSNYPIDRIAELVDGQDFVSSVSRGRTAGTQFNVGAWIEHMARTNQKLQMPKSAKYLNEVLLPPGNMDDLVRGDQTDSDMEYYIPRTRYVMELLTEQEIPYATLEGITSADMVRRRSYVVFMLPDRDKLIFANNGYGNATYIVHGVDMDDVELFMMQSKEELQNREDTSLVHWTKDVDAWKQRISGMLGKDFYPHKHEETQSVSESKDYERAPEGWLTNRAVARLLGRDPKTIDKMARNFISQDPTLIKEYIGVTGRIHEHYSPKLITLITEEVNRHESAPDGWLNTYSLSKTIDRTRRTIEKALEAYRESHPEWFKIYMDASNNLTEHYAPQLIEQIKKDIEDIAVAPAGWETNNAVAVASGRTVAFISSLADRYREQHPDWFHVYANERNAEYEHYAPELVTILLEAATQYESAPAGWLVNRAVAEMLGRSQEYVQRLASSYRDAHPQWFGEFLSPGGKPYEYYAPELLTELKKHVDASAPAPTGWLTSEQAGPAIGRDPVTIRKWVELYRTMHPDWFAQYEDSTGQINEHLHPELLAELKKQATSVERAEPGWLTTRALAKEVGRADATIKKQLMPYRESHPEWFKQVLDKRNIALEHMHPDLVEIIKIKNQIEG